MMMTRFDEEIDEAGGVRPLKDWSRVDGVDEEVEKTTTTTTKPWSIVDAILNCLQSEIAWEQARRRSDDENDRRKPTGKGNKRRSLSKAKKKAKKRRSHSGPDQPRTQT